jgi:mutator protein MutT
MNLKRKDVAIAVIEYRGQFFIQKRPSGGLLADLWEFPGGQREKGENFEDALAREVSEELNARVISSKLIINVKHFYTHFCANLHVFKCQVAPLPKIDRTHKWVSLKALKNYPVPSGTAKIVERLYLRK